MSVVLILYTYLLQHHQLLTLLFCLHIFLIILFCLHIFRTWDSLVLGPRHLLQLCLQLVSSLCMLAVSWVTNFSHQYMQEFITQVYAHQLKSLISTHMWWISFQVFVSIQHIYDMCTWCGLQLFKMIITYGHWLVRSNVKSMAVPTIGTVMNAYYMTVIFLYMSIILMLRVAICIDNNYYTSFWLLRVITVSNFCSTIGFLLKHLIVLIVKQHPVYNFLHRLFLYTKNQRLKSGKNF